MSDGERPFIDQTGQHWIVLQHNGEAWALGYNPDGLPMLRQVGDGDEITTNYTDPNAVRTLTPIPTRAEADALAEALEWAHCPRMERTYTVNNCIVEPNCPLCTALASYREGDR